MKNAFFLLIIASLSTACGRTENTSQATADSTATALPKAKNCRSVVDAGKLGKSDEYQESAKPIKVTLTLSQDTSTAQIADTCYFNNAVTVLTTKKNGSQLFKRTLAKDDLLLFTKNDETIQQAVLQQAVYKPTFNSQKYINLGMRLIDPASGKTTDYTISMNYFGEIVKVK